MKTCDTCKKKHQIDEFIFVDNREMCKKCALRIAHDMYYGSNLHIMLSKWNACKGGLK